MMHLTIKNRKSSNELERSQLDLLKHLDSIDLSKDEHGSHYLKLASLLHCPIYVNKKYLLDINNAILDELAYTLKRRSKNGRQAFYNFNDFEKFLGVKVNSLHQILYDRTFNFNKMNRISYMKLKKFINSYSDSDEIMEDLMTCGRWWYEDSNKKLSLFEKRKKLLELIGKEEFIYYNIEDVNFDDYIGLAYSKRKGQHCYVGKKEDIQELIAPLAQINEVTLLSLSEYRL